MEIFWFNIEQITVTANSDFMFKRRESGYGKYESRDGNDDF